ncbi:MAG: hypothetical protein LUD41_04355 [Phascolarctobacterium sp.]|nr:hypothetical protein [Phascolarctobacterium sp.]
MKKALRYLLLVTLALCFSVPCFSRAEAASVALLPFINNVEDKEKHDAQDLGKVYYENAFAVLNSKPGFLVVEDDTLLNALEKNMVAGQMPTEAQMRRIAIDGNVDIVIAMEIDYFDVTIRRGGEDDMLQMNCEGWVTAYNKLTQKYYRRRVYDDNTISEALTSRWDWPQEEFGRQMRREIEKILSVKNKKFM